MLCPRNQQSNRWPNTCMYTPCPRSGVLECVKHKYSQQTAFIHFIINIITIIIIIIIRFAVLHFTRISQQVVPLNLESGFRFSSYAQLFLAQLFKSLYRLNICEFERAYIYDQLFKLLNDPILIRLTVSTPNCSVPHDTLICLISVSTLSCNSKRGAPHLSPPVAGVVWNSSRGCSRRRHPSSRTPTAPEGNTLAGTPRRRHTEDDTLAGTPRRKANQIIWANLVTMAVRTAVILVANFGLLCSSQSYNMILDAICSTILCSRFCFWWNVKIVSTCENVAQSKTARQGLQIGLDLLDMDDMDMFGWYGYDMQSLQIG